MRQLGDVRGFALRAEDEHALARLGNSELDGVPAHLAYDVARCESPVDEVIQDGTVAGVCDARDVLEDEAVRPRLLDQAPELRHEVAPLVRPHVLRAGRPRVNLAARARASPSCVVAGLRPVGSL